MKRNEFPPTEYVSSDSRPSISSDDNSVDGLADEFENSWTPESINRLNAVLDSVPESERTDYLTELLHMEFELCFKNGRPVDVANYSARFPQYAKGIETVYAEVMKSRRLGVYELYEVLGKGGMGIVYRARHVLLDRIVAVKSLHSHILDNEIAVERFLREIRLIGQLKHPNIVNAENAGDDAGRYYLAMELVDGESVHRLISRYGGVPLSIGCEIVRQTALGLQYASEQGIIHRDIKPANLILQRTGLVKILDFGLGKFQLQKQPAADYALTIVGTTLGSVDYIAPEQWEDAASVTVRADIYSLGCTLFSLLTGRAPFEEQHLNRDQRMIAHIKGEIPSLRQFRKDVPDEIESCYTKMVAKNPEDRFTQPSEIARILEPYAAPLQDWMLTLSCWSEQRTKDIDVPAPIPKSLFRPNLFRLVVTILLPTVLLLSVIGGAYWYYSPDSSSNGPSPFDIGNAISPETLSISLPPVSVSPEFVQFVGHSGKWWFDDTPWFLPVVREGFADSFLAATVVDREALTRQTAENYRESGKDKERLTPILTSLLTSGVPNEKLLADFESSCEAAPTKTSERAAFLHTRAVFLHYLTQLHDDPIRGEKARALYAAALKAYDGESSETARLLGNLCRFDFAGLNFWFSRDPDEFQRQVQSMTITEKDGVAFRAELSATVAEHLMFYEKNPDVSFPEAFKLLESAGAVPRPSAHLAGLYRRYATALTRQWRLDESELYWTRAMEEFADIATFRTAVDECRLALAASARYCGDLKTARRRYRDLIENLQDAVHKHSGTENDASATVQRLVKGLEGLADCTLFVPTHFGNNRTRNANFYVEDAEDLYVEARNKAVDPVTQFVLRCKLAFLQDAVGDEEAAEKTWAIVRQEYENPSTGPTAQRATDYFHIGEAIFAGDEKACRIRTLLDAFRMNGNMIDRYADEKLDLHLFCLCSLLESELKSDVAQARNDCERYLDPILLQHLASAKKMRPFLISFYDLAIRCVPEADFVRTAEMIRTMRGRSPTGSMNGAHLIFYFSPTGENGFAIFLPSGLQDCRRFELDCNRQAIFDAVRNNQLLSLPAELVACVEKAWQNSVRVELFWNDSVCWTRGEESLTLEKWPFGQSLDRDRLFGVLR